jgi:hypothetical protein
LPTNFQAAKEIELLAAKSFNDLGVALERSTYIGNPAKFQ